MFHNVYTHTYTLNGGLLISFNIIFFPIENFFYLRKSHKIHDIKNWRLVLIGIY